MNSRTEVAIIGAGPYGLSIAAHLGANGTPYRIFGVPMQTWAMRMPAGMHLKSDGFASCLYAPGEGFSLKNYSSARGLAYADLGLPVPLQTFVDYGLAFQRKLVPTLEPTHVTQLHRDGAGFSLRLAHGETLWARQVVVATGVSHMEYVPPVLGNLSAELCTHGAEHHDLSGLRGREIIVIGAGASATDLAGLLHAQGTAVSLLSRRPVVFHSHARNPPSLWKRITRPNLGLGPNFRSAVYTAVPGLFRLAPPDLRVHVVRSHLGPAGGWFVREMVVGKVPMHCGYTVRQAEMQGRRAVLHCTGQDGADRRFEADHVIAATGYRISLSRLGFLDAPLLREIGTEDGSPQLSARFESSVPGLYFVGLAAAVTFGPLLRFAVGARYTARRLSAHLGRGHRRRHPSATAAVFERNAASPLDADASSGDASSS
ncbi:MAG: NAD(P)-binding domain-containing protein [Steroidobacteraceae bacterium]